MKIKRCWIVFVILFVVAVGYRSYQALVLVDKHSGLLSNSQNYTIYIMLGILVAVSLILFIIGMRRSLKEDALYEAKPNIPAGIFALTSSVMVFIDTISMVFGADSNFAQSSTLVLGTSLGIQVLKVLYLVFGILAGIQLLICAINSFMEKNVLSKISVISVALPLWLCIKVIHLTFVQYINILNAPENVVEVVSILTMILFFFLYAKLISGVATKRTLKYCFGVGLANLVCLSANVLPSIASNIMNNKYSSFKSMIADLLNITLLMFAFCIVLEISLFIKKNSGELNIVETVITTEEKIEIKKERLETPDELNDLNYGSNEVAELDDLSYNSNKTRTPEDEKEKDNNINDDISQKYVAKSLESKSDEKQIENTKNKKDANDDDVDMDYIDSLIDDILSEK